jgi:DNA-binding PadR family transcriptional regulator
MISGVFIYIGYPIYYNTMRRFSDDNGNFCCDMRGMLGFLILFLLSKRPMHGQELAEEIARRKGEKPSPGTIYPALKNLREMGFIGSDEKEGKTIVYTLTERGENALRISKRRFIRTFLGVFP